MPVLSKAVAAVAVASLTARTLATEPAGITRCQTGADDILGERKAFVVQVCNIFGATCYMNHPAVAADSCAAEALAIPTGECKLYPIFEYEDWAVRSGDSAVEELSTMADLGCGKSSSDGVYKWSGACVSVQCSLGSDTFAGPGMTGTSSSRSTGITDTATATFTANTLAELPDEADQLKNVFLVRTGDYVATTSTSSGSSNSVSYSVGSLPTSDGNSYGPVACPSSGNAMDSAAATGITAEELRMCGSGTGEWVYWNALNMIQDESLYATMTNDEGWTTNANINSVAFLDGESTYRASAAMDDPRKVYLHSGNTASSAVLLESATITPDSEGAAEGSDTAGAWRSYGVVFYCDDYARTDLTTCGAGNRKMLYVADPNPNAAFGAAPGDIAAGGGSGADASSARSQAALGTAALALAGAAGLVVAA